MKKSGLTQNALINFRKPRSCLLMVFLLCSPFNFIFADVQTDQQQLLQRLQWVPDTSANICHGYYIEPILDSTGAAILPPKESLTNISGASGTFSQGRYVLVGKVIVTQPGRRLVADKAYVYQDPKTNQITVIDLYGNIYVYEPGKLLSGNRAQINLNKRTWEINDVLYRLVLAPLQSEPGTLSGTVAWGTAKKAIQTQEKHSEYYQANYSTCAPDNVVWQLRARKIKLNQVSKRGTARDVSIVVKGVPILYTPYLTFPLSKERKTGFLFPSFGVANQSGFEFGLPFYWNIAPNYDATFTPTWYSKRGVLFKNDFRYLTQHSAGEVNFNFIPDDKEFKNFQDKAETNSQYISQFGFNDLINASDNRYLVSYKNNTVFNSHWTGFIDYAHVSDDYYFQNFGTIPEVISQNQLLQEAYLQYADEHWIFLGQLMGYQTLHPVNQQPVQNSYSRLPQLNLDGNFPDIYHGLDFTWHSTGTYYTASPGPNMPSVVNGGRVDAMPGISLPLNWMWGYFTPQVQFDTTYYTFQQQLSGFSPALTRTLPIVDVHTGIYFDRDFNLFNTPFQQTLEPEIFYLYIPYHDQSAIPLFDTGFIPFDYFQMFALNRYSGIDRVGDANQMTFALTTRFINELNGEEKFRFSLGQIYYFKRHQVTLCSTPGCNDYTFGFGAPPDNELSSPITAASTYHFTPIWSANGGVAWDPHVDKTITGQLYLAYSPAFNHIINIGYDYLRNGNVIYNIPNDAANNLHQASISTSWPININWSAVGIFNYNISQTHPQTYLGGLEYNSCCVRVRFVGGRVFSNVDQNGNFNFHNAFYFQLQLKGLGNIGTNSISDILTNSIFGYVDPFQRTY